MPMINCQHVLQPGRSRQRCCARRSQLATETKTNMNVYLYQPDGEQDNDVTFYMPHATNGVIVYLFKMGAEAAPDRTRLVSGYEAGRPIGLRLAVGACNDAFVLSCVRAPCVFRMTKIP